MTNHSRSVSLSTSSGHLRRLAIVASVGLMILCGGRAFAQYDTFYGSSAGSNESSCNSNYDSGFGYAALYNATCSSGGSYGNSAFGSDALTGNTTGQYNVAVGLLSLANNHIAGYNVGVGFRALFSNDATSQGTGTYNTAVGSIALELNSVASGNVAVGAQALYQNDSDAVGDANFNTAVGYQAMTYNTDGDRNSVLGYQALYSNETGDGNTATGADALFENTTGGSNTAIGGSALYFNTTGSYNTAVGYQAGYSIASADNTAVGGGAMEYATTASNNIAVGVSALSGSAEAPTTGSGNVALGYGALASDTSGSNNTAVGDLALGVNTTGKGNAAQGSNALGNNQTGIRNIGIGSNALVGTTAGSYNVAIGFNAGYFSQGTIGNDNIYINNEGISGDSQTMRLGTEGSPGIVGSGILSTYIAGIESKAVTGSAVYITSEGLLGVLISSERFKTDVRPMGAASDGLIKLRPVTFKLKSDKARTTQYGLIAEEVVKVYPELVIRGADGQINGVRYEELAPMLLNEVQQQRAQLEQQRTLNALQTQRIAALETEMARMNEFKQSVMRALGDQRSRDSLLAQGRPH